MNEQYLAELIAEGIQEIAPAITKLADAVSRVADALSDNEEGED